MKMNLEKKPELSKYQLVQSKFSKSDDDISRFTLVKIDDETYEKFKVRLYRKLKEICKMRNDNANF